MYLSHLTWQYTFIKSCVSCSCTLQKHAIQVIQGVIDVAKASVETIEDGDTYTSLLDCANMLNGEWQTGGGMWSFGERQCF